MSICMCCAAARLPKVLLGTIMLALSMPFAASKSEISAEVIARSIDHQGDSLSLIQKDVTMHQKDAANGGQQPTTTNFPAPPEGLDDWEKEFVSDRQGGPYYAEPVVEETTAAQTTTEEAKEKKKTESSITTTPAVQIKLVRNSFDVEEDSVSISVAGTLFGLAATITASVYVLGGTDGEKLDVCYSGVANAMGAFMAALIYSAIKDASNAVLLGVQFRTVGVSMTLDCCRLLFCFILTEVLLVVYKETTIQLKCVTVVGGYLCAFAAINAFEPFQHLYAFADTPFSSGTAAVMEFICMGVIFFINRQVRNSMHKKAFFDELVTTSWDKYLKAVEEVECMLVGISAGFLICRSAEFSALGAMPEGLPVPVGTWTPNTSAAQVAMMLGGALFFGAIAAFYAHWALGEWNAGHRKSDHAMQCFFFSASAWCFYTFVQYMCSRGTAGFGIGGDLRWPVMAAWVLSVLAICSLAMIAHNAHPHSYSEEAGEFVPYNVLLQSVGLVVGTAWACCFIRGSQGFSLILLVQPVQLLLSAMMCFLFALLMFILWASYIVQHMDRRGVVSDVMDAVEDLAASAGAVMGLTGPEKAWWPHSSWTSTPQKS